MQPIFRSARIHDLARIVELLADDPLGQTRECPGFPLDEAYVRAFEAIDADPNNELLVVELDSEVIGTAQLTIIANISHLGASRALVEGVRVAREHRSRGVGRQLINWIIEYARACDCEMVQLTSDRKRDEALRFYEEFGFIASHVGFKLTL